MDPEYESLEVGQTVSLKSNPGCYMSVARIPSEEHPDLLKPMQVECIWLDRNHQLHFSRFPMAMVQKELEKKPIGFQIKQQK